MKTCPYCGQEYSDDVANCVVDGEPLVSKSSEPNLQDEKKDLEDKIINLLPHVPMASIHSPQGWEYTVCELVTAQTTTGTGVFADFKSSFTDFFGVQSGTYNKKIREGENMCRNSLRIAALDSGGNAIIGVDVDYAEVGGAIGMLMVCMTGTAVKIHNMEVLDSTTVEAIHRLSEFRKRAADLARNEKIGTKS